MNDCIIFLLFPDCIKCMTLRRMQFNNNQTPRDKGNKNFLYFFLFVHQVFILKKTPPLFENVKGMYKLIRIKREKEKGTLFPFQTWYSLLGFGLEGSKGMTRLLEEELWLWRLPLLLIANSNNNVYNNSLLNPQMQ